jgi:hypothetical protein
VRRLLQAVERGPRFGDHRSRMSAQGILLGLGRWVVEKETDSGTSGAQGKRQGNIRFFICTQRDFK